VEQRGFTGTGFAGDERVLARALADGQLLQLRRAGTSDGHGEFLGGFLAPDLAVLRRDLLEGHFDAIGIFAEFADFVQEFGGELGRGRFFEHELRAGHAASRDFEAAIRIDQADTVLAQFIGNKCLRGSMALVPMNEGVNAATRSAGGDVAQALGGGLAEVHGERCNDQEMVFLGDRPRLRVVLGDRLVLVPQIHLDHLLHVLV
jgi:hypothetical protein